jgi:hypothetical protein
MANTLRSVLWSVAGILVCGVAGGVFGWGLVTALGMRGVPAALLGAIVGMVVATAAWVVLTWALRKLGAQDV